MNDPYQILGVSENASDEESIPHYSCSAAVTD